MDEHPHKSSNIWKQITKARANLAKIDESESNFSELIDSTNMIRVNDTLMRSGRAKSELIGLYENYIASLEGIVDSALDLQTELFAIMKTQSNLQKASKKTLRRAKKTKRASNRTKSKPKSKKRATR